MEYKIIIFIRFARLSFIEIVLYDILVFSVDYKVFAVFLFLLDLKDFNCSTFLIHVDLRLSL